MRLIIYVFLILLPLGCFADMSVENTIIEQMEFIQGNPERLEKNKYAPSQLQDIERLLRLKRNKYRIISYNMLFDLYDSTLPEEYRWQARLPRIVKYIEIAEPDAFGVQELQVNQLQDFAKQLSKTYAYYAPSTTKGEINAIFYNKERLKLIKGDYWPMGTGKGRKKPNDLLVMATLEDRQTKQQFSVFNVHLCFSDAEKREQQAVFIQQHIDSLSKGTPYLLMGDMNTFPPLLIDQNLPFYDGYYINEILTKGHLADSERVALIGHLGPLGSFTSSPSSPMTPFSGNGIPGVILDHIYVSPKMKVLIQGIDPVKVDGHFPSDHMPIVVDFVIEAHSPDQFVSNRKYTIRDSKIGPGGAKAHAICIS